TSRPTIARAISAGEIPAVGMRATVAPARITVIASLTSITSSSLCVMSTTVPPWSRSARSTRQRSRTSGGESTAVGSSRMRMRAPRSSVLMISTRCASPTERSATRRLASTSSPVSRLTRSTARTAAARSNSPRAVGSRPSTTFSATVSVGTSMKCWCTIPTPAAIACAVLHPVASRPSTCTVPASGAYMPASTRMSVDFPAPFSPTSAWISPAGTSSEAPRLARTAPNDFSTWASLIASGVSRGGGVIAAECARHRRVTGDE
ncbi:MAG: hypothetical protein AVDCRST_MAG40-457, partial [uncultured Gemmatimonadaceae bacterium]